MSADEKKLERLPVYEYPPPKARKLLRLTNVRIVSQVFFFGLFVFLFAFIFMAIAQLRHAIWDRGAMLEPEKNNTLSYVMVAFALVASLVLTLVISGVFS